MIWLEESKGGTVPPFVQTVIVRKTMVVIVYQDSDWFYHSLYLSNMHLRTAEELAIKEYGVPANSIVCIYKTQIKTRVFL